MIPKKIHYCWFGGKEKPKSVIECIETWKKFCGDYEIIEWNEKNFDVNVCQYTRDAYKEGKWAFITDYVRLYAMVTEGGIYMDTDVEVVKNLDIFLDNQAFSGFQTNDSIPTGIMACEKNYKIFKELLEEYNDRSFYNNDGSLNLITNVEYITNKYLKYGLVLNNCKQCIQGFMLYPVDYFCAKSWKTGIVNKTEFTYTIHHFAGSWLPLEEQKLLKVNTFCSKYFGPFSRIAFLIYKYILKPNNIVKKIKKVEKS